MRLTAERRLPSSLVLLVATLGTILLFLFAVQLLGEATDAAAPVLRQLLQRVVVGDASALGVSWLGAYVLANGSVIAALALSLFTSGLVSASQLFVMIAGSRLGAAAIVVFVGALDYVQKERYGIQEAVSMGLLAFLVTHSIYLPVTVVGYLSLPILDERFLGVSGNWAVGFRPLSFFDPLVTGITARIGAGPAVVLAVGVLFGSLRLFDRILDRIDTATIRDRFLTHLERTWLSFLVGLAITTLTTSVAFSLGVIVPLYNRDYVKRDELLPYVLGANLGTLFDTLVVAVVLETSVGIATVLFLLAVATLVTIAVLAVHDRYADVIGTVDDLLVTDRRAFVTFAAVLVLVPLALVFVPLALVLTR